MSTRNSKDRDDEAREAKTGTGSTDDPNQANRSPLPRMPEEKPDIRPGPNPDPEDPKTGAGSTKDPNQANRT